MINALITWLVTTILVIIGSYIIPGITLSGGDFTIFGMSLEGFNVALVVALIFGILNAFVRPVLGIIALPITILTLGLFALVLNAGMVWLTSLIVTGFDIDGFWAAFWFGLYMSVACSLLGAVLSKNKA